VQDTLGATNAGAFDLSAACTGFILALNMAAQAIITGAINNALVIGSETLSRLVDWEDRGTCVLFGDGAGAFVLQASERPGGVLSAVMRSDGSGGSLLSVPAGGSRYPATHETVSKKMHLIHMNGREVFRFATRVMAGATREVVERAGLELDDIELVIPHQANERIIESAARGLGLPMDRFMMNIDRYGNTSSASIPIAACEALERGRIRAGDHLVMVAFGGGLTWGALAMQWVAPEAKVPPSRRRRRAVTAFLARVRSVMRRIIRIIEGLIWGASSHVDD
jgi:3-oxoacyl-[acyl-carrier-protein] synthase-3